MAFVVQLIANGFYGLIAAVRKPIDGSFPVPAFLSALLLWLLRSPAGWAIERVIRNILAAFNTRFHDANLPSFLTRPWG